jgi:hypothetical protein
VTVHYSYPNIIDATMKAGMPSVDQLTAVLTDAVDVQPR